MKELDFIAELRSIATHPAARGLADDVAVLTVGRQKLVLTHDVMVEGVHFRTDADPADVAWKLVAVNLSDLAAKGARPMGVLLGFGGGGDESWQRRFLTGLGEATDACGVPLIGGDTVGMPDGGARCLGMTAIGEARGPIVQSRADAQAGDVIYVTGPIGDGWAGLQLDEGAIPDADPDDYSALIAAYRRPQPLIAQGRALSAQVRAMMDISDGLLIDAQRMASASSLAITLDLDRVPLSDEFCRLIGRDRDAVLQAASGGDDYQLLFAAGREVVLPVPATCIGFCERGEGLILRWKEEPIPLPEHLGFLHS